MSDLTAVKGVGGPGVTRQGMPGGAAGPPGPPGPPGASVPLLASGALVFGGPAGEMAQDNVNLFWNNTTDQLGIGTSAPGFQLHIKKDQDAGTFLQVENIIGGVNSIAGIQLRNNVATGALQTLSSASPNAASTNVWDRANATTLTTSNDGGISIAARSASGKITFHTGGIAARLGLHASGGLGLNVTTDPGLGNFALSGALMFGTGLDAVLLRDAANVLAQRNGVTPQGWRVYNTWINASNYEHAALQWTSNVAQFGSFNAGTGVARDVSLVRGGAEQIRLASTGPVITGLTTVNLNPAVAAEQGTGLAVNQFLRTYNDGATPGNYEFAYVGEWFVNTAIFGVGRLGSGQVRDLAIQRGNTSQLRFEGKGVSLFGSIPQSNLALGNGQPDVTLTLGPDSTYRQYQTRIDALNWDAFEMGFIPGLNTFALGTTMSGTGAVTNLIIARGNVPYMSFKAASVIDCQVDTFVIKGTTWIGGGTPPVIGGILLYGNYFQSNGNFVVQGLPTTAPATSGQFWRDPAAGNVVKCVP